MFFQLFLKNETTEDYILRQPEKYQVMVLHLMAVIERVVPEVELLFKYGKIVAIFNLEEINHEVFVAMIQEIIKLYS